MASPRVTRLRSRLSSDGSLTKKASLNSIAQALHAGSRIVVGFVANPILVRYLGDVTFGQWQVLYRLVGQADPAGGRPSEALKWLLANRQSSDDGQAKREAVGSAIAVWVLFLPLLVAVGAVVAWFAPIWLDVAPGDQRDVRLAAVVLLIGVLVMGLTNISWASLVGQNLGYRRMGLTSAIEFLAGALLIAAAVLGAGLVGLAAATITGTILSGLLYLWLARRYIPWFGVAKPHMQSTRRFLGLSWWFLLWNVVSRVMMAGDVVVLGIAGSATEATSYSLARFVPLTITVSVASIIFGMAPGLGGVIGAGETERAARVRNETMSVTWLMATIAGAGVLLWQRSFIDLWVGARFYPGVVATVLIVVMVLQLSVARVDSNIIDLTLNVRTKVLLGLLAAALSVAFAWVLVARFNLGIAGVTIGFMVGRAVQSVAYPMMVGRLLEIPVGIQLRGLGRAATTTLALFAASAALGEAVRVDSWMGLVMASAVSAVALAGAAFAAGLSASQRAGLLNRAHRVARLK